MYLARSPKGVRTREHLTGLLWGDKPEEKARHSLNEAVHVLRLCAGDDGFQSDTAQVRIAPGTVELDTDTFERLAVAGAIRTCAVSDWKPWSPTQRRSTCTASFKEWRAFSSGLSPHNSPVRCSRVRTPFGDRASYISRARFFFHRSLAGAAAPFTLTSAGPRARTTIMWRPCSRGSTDGSRAQRRSTRYLNRRTSRPPS